MKRRYSNRSFRDTSPKVGRGQSGQIVVEYILLLSIAVIVAALITKTMVSTDKDNPGFVLTAWQSIVKTIGADNADDIDRTQ